MRMDIILCAAVLPDNACKPLQFDFCDKRIGTKIPHKYEKYNGFCFCSYISEE